MTGVYPFSSDFRLYGQKGGDPHVLLRKFRVRVLVDIPDHAGLTVRSLFLWHEKDARNWKLDGLL